MLILLRSIPLYLPASLTTNNTSSSVSALYWTLIIPIHKVQPSCPFVVYSTLFRTRRRDLSSLTRTAILKTSHSPRREVREYVTATYFIFARTTKSRSLSLCHSPTNSSILLQLLCLAVLFIPAPAIAFNQYFRMHKYPSCRTPYLLHPSKYLSLSLILYFSPSLHLLISLNSRL